METNQEHEELFQNPKELFELLLEKCSEKQVYSVRELAASMNVQYEEIQELAALDERFSHILGMCRMRCFSRAMKDGLYKKLSFKKSVKYMEENDDDFKVPEGFFQEVEDDEDFSDENEVEEDAIFEF
jgi:hypothetical protein